MNNASIVILLFCLLLNGCYSNNSLPTEEVPEIPEIYPEYVETTLPCNIAPVNFAIKESGTRYKTEIGYGEKVILSLTEDSPEVRISINKWKTLLKEAKGGKIFFRIAVLRDGKWSKYRDIENTVSADSIDEYLVYRLLYPGYELWNEMGIYQRNLSDYKETPVIENSSIDRQCMNCHTFMKNTPETMMLHIRGKNGGTIIYNNGTLEKVNMKPQGFNNSGTYPSWHPSGRYIAFSVNEIRQFFHASGHKPIEVADMAADLALYDLEKHEMFADSLLCGPRYMETFPNWSPDGKTLYYCRADSFSLNKNLDSIYYDLYKVSFDSDTREFGTPVCLYEASKVHKSVSFPRVSPDGNYLMFVISGYGNFSIWHSESDLCLLDLKTGCIRRMDEVNSNQAESFHTWSSDGNWFVFSSKRNDGLWARPYISFFDSQKGCASKPFVLPQKDPFFYDTFTKTYNLPELITSPIKIGSDIRDAFYETAVNAVIK